MLKQNNIKNICMSNSATDTCWNETVPDYSAIAACNTKADIQIRGIKQTIEECNNQIESYQNLVKDISDRYWEAEKLQDNYSTASTLASNANLNINFDGCNNCIEGVKKSYLHMLSECDTKVTEWTEKKEQAEQDLEAAEQAKADCANITKTIRVCG